MKQELNSYLKVITVVLLMPLCFIKCQQDTIEQTEKNRLETVSLKAAKNFLDNPQTLQKTNTGTSVTPYTDYITQTDIINSDEMLTVVPAITSRDNSYSRILLLNINGEIETVVYSMFSTNNFTTEQFYGNILITDLDDNYINGFRVEDGYLVAKYINNQEQGDTANKSSNSNCTDCTFDCDLCTLDEVVIESTKREVEIGELFTSIVPDQEDLAESLDLGDSGGGGFNGDDNTCQPGYVRNLIGIDFGLKVTQISNTLQDLLLLFNVTIFCC